MTLTADRARELFAYDADTGLLVWRAAGGRHTRLPAGRVAGTPDHFGHLVVNIDGKTHRVHRVIWLIVTDDWPSHVVDHEDRDPANNRWVNLRDVPQSVNAKNCKALGIYWCNVRRRWVAQLKRDYRRVACKRFVCFGQAVAFYRKARNAHDAG